MTDHNGELIDIDGALLLGVRETIDTQLADDRVQYGTGGTATVVYYKMVGRDSACFTPTYHAWVVQNTPDFAGAQAGALPCGGPLVDIYIADTWT
jgi:hypothetical protein